jgi:hypothetical protein
VQLRLHDGLAASRERQPDIADSALKPSDY